MAARFEVIATALNLRAAPDKGSAIVTVLKKGQAGVASGAPVQGWIDRGPQGRLVAHRQALGRHRQPAQQQQAEHTGDDLADGLRHLRRPQRPESQRGQHQHAHRVPGHEAAVGRRRRRVQQQRQAADQRNRQRDQCAADRPVRPHLSLSSRGDHGAP